LRNEADQAIASANRAKGNAARTVAKLAEAEQRERDLWEVLEEIELLLKSYRPNWNVTDGAVFAAQDSVRRVLSMI